MGKINYDALFGEMTKKMEEKNIGDSKDFLKLEVGSVVTGRLLMDINSLENSIFHYNWHNWHSKKKKELQFNVLCPTTHGEECPICNYSKKLYFSKNESLKQYSKAISRRQSSMVNFYVINDNKHPENNGTIKILRYGLTIKKIIDDATIGESASSFGPKVWRLDENGCNFRIKADPNSNDKDKSKEKDAWPTYVASCFLPPSRIEGMTDQKQEEILKSIFDLRKRYELKSYTDLKTLVEDHYISCIPELEEAISRAVESKEKHNPIVIENKDSSKDKGVVKTVAKIDLDDKVPFEFDKIESPSKKETARENVSQTEEISSEVVDDWLKEIENS